MGVGQQRRKQSLWLPVRWEDSTFSMKGAHTWAGLLGSSAGAPGVCSSWPFVTEASEVLHIGLGLTQGQRPWLQAWRSRITLSCPQTGQDVPREVQRLTGGVKAGLPPPPYSLSYLEPLGSLGKFYKYVTFRDSKPVQGEHGRGSSLMALAPHLRP